MKELGHHGDSAMGSQEYLMFWKSRAESVSRRRRWSAVEEATDESRELKSKKGPLDLAAGQVEGPSEQQRQRNG